MALFSKSSIKRFVPVTTEYLVEETICFDTTRTKIVPESDPTARFLIAVAGDRISYEDALKYGLVDGPDLPEDYGQPKSKSIKKAENKAVTNKEDK